MDKDKSLIAATQKQAQKIRIDQLGYLGLPANRGHVVELPSG